MILIALGANLPAPDGAAPVQTCNRAVRALRGLSGLRLAAVSPWYGSRPVPPSGQPPSVNGVVRLEGEADPASLLAALQAIEQAHGRVRTEPDAARTLDLDIVAMGGLIRAAPDPVLPHPRMHGREFVLRPLLDVAPDWWHPVLQKPVQTLLNALPQQGCWRL